MRRVFGGLATFAAVAAIATPALAGEPLKPYVFLVVDTSGSMIDNATGFGPPSCPGSVDTRLDHAKCAIAGIANSYGDMVVGLGRFRESSTDTNPANGCSMNGVDCTDCCERRPRPGSELHRGAVQRRPARGAGRHVRRQQQRSGDAGTTSPLAPAPATTIANNPDIYIGGWTPIAGSLNGTKRYWQGLQASDGTTLLASGQPGFDPIRNDPLRNVFLPSGRQCRPYIVISLTDGEESCTQFSNTTAAAASLLTTAVDTRTYRIETKAIGFGVSPGNSSIEGIAHAGGATDVAGVNEGIYVQNEEQLQLAISSILAEAVKFEQCNNLDDDCDTLIDEDFPNRGAACDNGLFGICRGTGTYGCTRDRRRHPPATSPARAQSADGPRPATPMDDDCDNRIDEGLSCSLHRRRDLQQRGRRLRWPASTRA
jgi:hypothetical protein